MRPRLMWILLAVVVLGGGTYLSYRFLAPRLSDREEIERLILKAARGVEQRQVAAVLSVIADDYWDHGYTKQDLATLARGMARFGEQIRVVPYLNSLDLSGSEATASVDAEVTVGRSPEQPVRYHVMLHLGKGRHGWQVISSQGWQGAVSQLDAP
jgi:hypothetical protein